MNLKQAAWFSAVPWGTMAISGFIAGATSDYLIKAGFSLTRVRKIMQVPLFPLCSSTLYVVVEKLHLLKWFILKNDKILHEKKKEKTLFNLN